MSDTIFALASGAGVSAVAVIRMSGPKVGSALEMLAGRILHPRRATLTELRDPGSGALLDRALAIWFPGPSSFTGEDCGELHLHGGRAVVAGALSALAALEGFRVAEPGEFARRAFVHGKLDLTEAEGLADLIEANTAAQRDLALAQSGGRLSSVVDRWRSLLLEMQTRIEAEIDFSDEGDVPLGFTRELMAGVEALKSEIRRAMEDRRRSEILRDGFTVVIAGPPNAGKSSLLNALAGRDAAIVSDIPGTTRDVIEVFLDLGGLPVVLVDTAGLRSVADSVEAEGIRRALERTARADLVLSLAGPGQLHEAFETECPIIRVRSKADLEATDSGAEFAASVSVRTGDGLESLLGEIEKRARSVLRVEAPALVTSVRQEAALARSLECISRLRSDSPIELVAEDLRLAARELAALIGMIGPEEILGEIFGRFCIGK